MASDSNASNGRRKLNGFKRPSNVTVKLNKDPWTFDLEKQTANQIVQELERGLRTTPRDAEMYFADVVKLTYRKEHGKHRWIVEDNTARTTRDYFTPLEARRAFLDALYVAILVEERVYNLFRLSAPETAVEIASVNNMLRWDKYVAQQNTSSTWKEERDRQDAKNFERKLDDVERRFVWEQKRRQITYWTTDSQYAEYAPTKVGDKAVDSDKIDYSYSKAAEQDSAEY